MTKAATQTAVAVVVESPMEGEQRGGERRTHSAGHRSVYLFHGGKGGHGD